MNRDEFVELLYHYGAACEQAQLTGADYKQAEGRVLAAFDAQAAEVEALRAERSSLKGDLGDAQSETRAAEVAADHQRERAKAAERTLEAERGVVIACVARAEKAEAETEALRAERDLMLHKVIACGVAATRPDLSRRAKDYGGKWDSPQAESVRKVVERALLAESLLAEAVGALRGLVTRLDFVHESASYRGVWSLYAVHGGRYEGPKYIDELANARALLAKIGGTK